MVKAYRNIRIKKKKYNGRRKGGGGEEMECAKVIAGA